MGGLRYRRDFLWWYRLSRYVFDVSPSTKVEKIPLLYRFGVDRTALDALWVYIGVLDYGADTLAFGPLRLAPLWITFLWVGLGLSHLKC